ncbi:hypothetical protein ACH5RR_016047 [Cinchona calisaya]|uniref:F-box associated beta-propeller type 3 domain-containing protein n=1 Tax=Cinchona calisaya TaxID=153742 RepID=A0ABD2ZV88_9GENT
MNEYKVLTVCNRLTRHHTFHVRGQTFRRSIQQRKMECEIYTLGLGGTPSWRKLENRPPKMLWDAWRGRPVVSSSINGSINWLVSEGGNDFLIVFDVRKEIFRVTKFKEHLNLIFTSIYEIQGRLTILRSSGDGKGSGWCTSLFFLEEYENQVLLRDQIDCPAVLGKFGRFSLGGVLGISPSGEIIFLDHNYDFLEGSFTTKIFYFNMKIEQE